MRGYDPEFLGKPVPLPDYAPHLDGEILRRDTLADGDRADYPNYSLVMNAVQRTAVYVALNVDQQLIKSVRRRDNWRVDTRVGADFQLNNDYYRNNPWDRGHLARRSTAAWGRDERIAQRASDETFYYPNASLQHANFNQDEWLALEDWVKDLKDDSTDRISVFSGPVFGEFPRRLRPEGRPPAEIPTAYFKVVCFINKAADLEVRAFLMAQDAEALADRRGRRMFDYQRYQVTVAEIEERTGLRFHESVAKANPLFFWEKEETEKEREELGVGKVPERCEVDSENEMIGHGDKRTTILDEDVPVFIAGAMVNAKGDERAGEWVSIINLSGDTVNLDGWTLSETKRAPLALSGPLEPGQARRIQPIAPMMLANSGGVIVLFDNQGRRIDRVKYPKQSSDREGVPVVFATRAVSEIPTGEQRTD